MPRRFAIRALVGLAALAIAAASGAHAKATTFESAFATRGEPADAHYRVVYGPANAPRHLEVWREGETRVKRVTDGVIEVQAARRPRRDDFQMMVLDRRRHTLTKVNRTNLYRIGDFTDWFDLTHGLRHPRGAYRIRYIARPKGAPTAGRACRWTELAQGARKTDICWSAATGLPWVIMTDTGAVAWRITSFDDRKVAASAFRVDARGYTRVDADQDISAD